MGQVKGLNPEEGFGANSVAGQQKCSEMVQDKFHSDSSLAAANINIDVDGPEQIKTPSISTSSPPQHNTQSSDSEFDKKPDTNSHTIVALKKEKTSIILIQPQLQKSFLPLSMDY